MNPELECNNEPSLRHVKFDEAAFEIFFKNNFVSLCSFCQIKFGFDLDLAKEAVHTGFIKLWESRQTLSDDLSIQAYLFKIISNSCVDMLRHQQVKQRYEKHVLQLNANLAFQHGPDNPDYKLLVADVDKAVSELPEQMRRIFKMSRYDGLKYAEISRQLSISVKTVETQMSRALVKLRQKLSKYLLLLPVFLLSL